MEVCRVEKETEAGEGANHSISKCGGLAGCSRDASLCWGAPGTCYGAKVWMGHRGHHVAVYCFFLQVMERNISKKSNPLVQNTATSEVL